MASNGTSLPLRNDSKTTQLNRADEVDDVSQEFSAVELYKIYQMIFVWRFITDVLKLLNAVQSLIIPFIRSADEDASAKPTGHGLAIPGGGPRTALVEHHKPEKLLSLMNFELPGNGKGKDGLLATVEQVLKYSVNTWDQGFLDKLYASTNAVS